MQSPLMDIDTLDAFPERRGPESAPVYTRAGEKTPLPGDTGPFPTPPAAGAGLRTALILAPQTAYSEAAMEKISHHIHTHLFLDVREKINACFDPDQDREIFTRIKNSPVDQVILVHEVWQPPSGGFCIISGRSNPQCRKKCPYGSCSPGMPARKALAWLKPM
nr:hypothetical protein [Desulfobacula sp.]